MQLLIFSLIFSLTIYISHSEVNLLIVKTEDNKLNATCVASGEDAVTPIMFYDKKYQAHIPHKSNNPIGYGTVREFFTSPDIRYWISDLSRTGRLFSDNKWTDFYYTKTSNVQIKSNLFSINGYEFCLSIFLARCEYYCSFQLDLIYHDDTRTGTITKIVTSAEVNLTYTFMVYVYDAKLTITTIQDDRYYFRGAFWAILAIAKCHTDGEIQIINAIYDTERSVSCITLNSKHTILGNLAKDMSECPWGYYGLNCNRICSEVLGPSRDSCQGVLSCTQDNKCKCNRGYWGGHCKNRCGDSKTNKMWSRLCHKSCGKCIGGSKCDVETGQCPSGCEDGFTGNQCLVPPAVQDFQVFSHSPNRIGLRWKPPNPPNGVIEYYKIEHCDSTSCKWKTAGSSQCEVWEDYLCYTISKDIFEEYNYTIKISAKNKGVENFGPESKTTTETRYAKPSAPTNFSVHLDDNNNILYVHWSHPVENGPVHNFEIHLVPIDSINSAPMNRKMKVNNILKIYSEQFTNLNYSSKYRVCVRGNNEQIGKDACIEIATKPAIPEFEHQPEIILNNDETFTVNIPSTKGRTNCSVLVIASKNEYAKINETNIDLKKVQSDFNNSKFIENLSEKTSVNNKLIYNLIENVRANKTVYFTIILSNKYLNDYKHKIYKTMWDPYEKHNSNNFSYLYLLILLIIPIMFIITMYFIKKKNKIPHHIDEIEIRQQNRVNPLIEEDHSQPANYLYQNLPSRSTVQSSKVRNMKKMPEDITDVESQRILDKRLNIDPNMSCLVKMTEFKNYVKQALENNELQRQHLLFPRGMVKACEYGELPENKAKNRYKNLTAYDDTRVILTEINGDPYSDYINANFIDGYNTPNAYIATQGPKSNTVNDFWRMIWEQNSTNIIMVANVVENGKKKCEEYWPKLNELKVYGEIRVKHDQTEVYADYVRRRFTVNFKTMKRTIEQLHFTSWPDHGVPMYPSLLVPLLKQMVTIPMPGPPVVVHCSAGVGRTGTIILCDICIRMAKIENSIDVLGQLYLMRANRTNLVDNFDQYKLVHLILLESLIVPVTNFPCNSTFINDIKRLVTTKALQKQIKVIEDNSWMDNAMKTTHNREGTHLEPENMSKNRFQHILPDDNNELHISRWPYNDIHSDYINAVYVDGYRNKGQFIVTQQPMPNTLGDFWRMVLEKEAYVIVSLNTIDPNDETSVLFYPEKDDLMTPVPYLTIQNTKTELVGFYNQITLKLFDSSLSEVEPEKKSVIVVQLNDWAPTMLKPPGPIIPYVQLWETLERLSNNVKPIVVMCHDGATASGLFTALSFVIEKIKLEQECDVCLAVRTIRHNRKIFVKRIEQFEYLYKASIAYFNSFQLYSNFNSVNDPNLDA